MVIFDAVENELSEATEEVELVRKTNYEDYIEKLRGEEEVVSAQVIEIECAHKEESSRHRECVKKLYDIRRSIDEIEKDLREKAEEYKTIAEEANGYIQRMNELSEQRRGKVAELDEIREEIRNSERVVLLVYKDGNIELDGGVFDISFDETGKEDIFEEMMNNTLCEELSVKSLRLLARVIAIVRNCPCEEVNVMFDDDELEMFYQEFK